ncbi:MAG: DNA/RNA helicase domain-containing protein [Erysipelotrichaceae bacterium]|jgi:DUF2075 family protein/DNA replication protein DnaC
MIIYKNNKKGFVDDVRDGVIARKIASEFAKINFNYGNDREYRSWANSLNFMRNAIDDAEISDECQIAIEYKIPLTEKRVDFLIAGIDENNNNNIVVVELKQWENSSITNSPDVVETYVGGGNRLVCHPSYQAYSYAKVIENFNEDVHKNDISLIPCAYLHNYKEINRNNIDNDFYREAIKCAPVFLEEDTKKLRDFIKSYIKKKDNIDLLMKIEFGKLKPAKALQDAIASMLRGNDEFNMIDEQKVAYETVRMLVEKSLKESNEIGNQNKKYTVIVEGGPGTGKTVVAIQLLSNLINKGYAVNYITKNAAPRHVFFEKLKRGRFNLNYIKSLFKGSGSFVNVPNNYFDCLIVDEAHRLNEKSGMFKNYGENQIKEIIHASKVSVFFIDEDQIVTTDDIGSVELIKKFAKEEGSKVFHGEDYNLVSQFRCNGSDGYLAFLDNLLSIRKTANIDFDFDYDLKLFDNPTKMREELRKKNANNKARMIAGYCYDWITKNNNDPNLYDIVLENDFKAKWNFNNTKTWAIDADSFDQVGCIHTAQGLEFDYCGIIIGKDLIFKDNKVITDYTKRAKTDRSLWGIKKTKNYELADKIIKNTYKTLMSRGQKGCYLYCEDKGLLDYISKITKIKIE